MATIPESAGAVIESGRLAHLITLHRDGSSQLTFAGVEPWVGGAG